MKKPIIYLLLALVLILGTGCDLFPYMGKEVYFYSMAGPNEEPSTFELKQRDGGHIILSIHFQNSLETQPRGSNPHVRV